MRNVQRYHYTEPYLLNPNHRVSINLVGAGGTGSYMLTKLALLNSTLRAIGHPGIHVTVYDKDNVSQANFGRQLFFADDIGKNKAEILVKRVNINFGYDWDWRPWFFEFNSSKFSYSNIIRGAKAIGLDADIEKPMAPEEAFEAKPKKDDDWWNIL